MSGWPLVWSKDWMASICVSGRELLAEQRAPRGAEAEIDDGDADARARQAVRLQRVGADPLDALRDHLIGNGHLGRTDAAHAGQAPYLLGQPGRVAHLQQRAGPRRDRRAEPGERTADGGDAPGGGGDGERASRRRGPVTACIRKRHARDRAQRRGCEHETAHTDFTLLDATRQSCRDRE